MAYGADTKMVEELGTVAQIQYPGLPADEDHGIGSRFLTNTISGPSHLSHLKKAAFNSGERVRLQGAKASLSCALRGTNGSKKARARHSSTVAEPPGVRRTCDVRKYLVLAGVTLFARIGDTFWLAHETVGTFTARLADMSQHSESWSLGDFLCWALRRLHDGSFMG